MISKLHTLYGVNIDLAATNIFINQVSSWNFDSAIEEILESGDGVVDPTFVAVLNQNPRMKWTTSKVGSILTTIGISGLNILADGSNDGIEFWLQKIAEGGTRESGSNHLKLTMAKGMVFVRSISASNDKIATVEMEAIATYDGTNNPFIIADSQALEGSVGSSEGFVVGPVNINGTTIEGIQDINIDFGISEIVQSSDGEVWPSFAAIGSRKPTITIKTTDVITLDTFGLTGVAQGITDSVIYLRKVAEGGTRVPNATTEHISFTVDEGRISVQNISADDNGQAMSEIKITPTYDGTNEILLISTSAAIT